MSFTLTSIIKPFIYLFYRRRLARYRSTCWSAKLENLSEWFEENDEVTVFIDGFGGLGFRRATTAIKLRSLNGNKAIRTVMEWRGDEKTLKLWLPSFQVLMNNTSLIAKVFRVVFYHNK